MFKVAVLGSQDRTNELKEKIKDKVTIDLITEKDLETSSMATYEIIFDLNADERENAIPLHTSFKGYYLPCSVLRTLYASAYTYPKTIGINALPGFINRSLLEASTLDKTQALAFTETAAALGWQLTLVEDRVGMVTPRIVAMIINEAYYTLQEGTADEAAIDTGMKLGTNYPFGPFEWANRIGIVNIYKLISSIYKDTFEERYKICALLKRRAMP